MADPAPSNGFLAGVLAAGGVAALGVAKIVQVIAAWTGKPAAPPEPQHPMLGSMPGECIGCSAVRAQLDAFKREAEARDAAQSASIAVIDKGVAVMVALAETREQNRIERERERERRDQEAQLLRNRRG